ncbi:MAG: hypothetical protein HY099_00465 [Nitrospirae bacterium]|nr:hypothetical protein [Nitrospirota bacterium]
MICRKRNRFACLVKPFSSVLLLFLIFGIVWLRSSVVSLEYSLSNLEKKKMELTRDKKALMAEQANLLYIGRLESVAANGAGLGFPDRVRVVYVKKAKNKEAYRASLMLGNESR